MREGIGLIGLGSVMGLVAGLFTQHNYLAQSAVIGVGCLVLIAAFVWKRAKSRV